MLAWKQLPFFLAVAREGSLRAGAETLGATHATTRRQIDALEARLGVRLLLRSRRGVTPTEAGRRLMAEALQAERHVTAAENRVRGLDREMTGTIRFSTEPLIAQVLLAPILALFLAEHPEIDLEMRVGDEFDDVAGQEADVALRHAVSVGPGVTATRLFPLTVAIYASRSYLAEALPTAGARGEGLAWIGHGDGGMAERIAASPFPAAPVRCTAPDTQTHLELVLAGAGLAVLPLWVETRYPQLRRLPGSVQETSHATWLVTNADLARLPRVRHFVDHLSRGLTSACAPLDTPMP